jgi:hypothetical protein
MFFNLRCVELLVRIVRVDRLMKQMMIQNNYFIIDLVLNRMYRVMVSIQLEIILKIMMVVSIKHFILKIYHQLIFFML